MAHNEKINANSVSKITEMIESLEIKKQILETKMEIADLKAKEHIQKQHLNAQKLGTARVNRARQLREQRQASKNPKVYNEDNRVNLRLDLNKAISDKRKDRNYMILKNANRKRFQSIVDRKNKQESI